MTPTLLTVGQCPTHQHPVSARSEKHYNAAMADHNEFVRIHLMDPHAFHEWARRNGWEHSH